jgi:hypothetical protein
MVGVTVVAPPPVSDRSANRMPVSVPPWTMVPSPLQRTDADRPNVTVDPGSPETSFFQRFHWLLPEKTFGPVISVQPEGVVSVVPVPPAFRVTKTMSPAAAVPGMASVGLAVAAVCASPIGTSTRTLAAMGQPLALRTR